MTDREFIGKMYFLLQREPRATVICDQLEDMLAERLKQPETRPATREEKIVRPGVYEVPVEQEPEPWKVEEVYKDGVLFERRMKRGPDCGWEPLLTPPRREWVGLEQSDMPDGEDPIYDDPRFIAGIVWAAKKLQEKNNAP